MINIGEVQSPLPVGNGDDVGELRLQSDFSLARGKLKFFYKIIVTYAHHITLF